MKILSNSGDEQDVLENLSPRQRELLDMLLSGIPPKVIAFNLNIAYNTLLYHQKNLYKKLNVHNVHELIVKYSPEAKNAADETILKSKTITINKNALFITIGILFGLLTTTVIFLIMLLLERNPMW